MFSVALIGYEKVLGRDHKNCKLTQAKLNALNTSPRETDLPTKLETSHAQKISQDRMHLGTEERISTSKRRRLLKMLPWR